MLQIRLQNLPIIGLSPTLPGCLAVIPPVDVAKATFPSLSRATAPTVSWPLPSDLHKFKQNVQSSLHAIKL